LKGGSPLCSPFQNALACNTTYHAQPQPWDKSCRLITAINTTLQNGHIPFLVTVTTLQPALALPLLRHWFETNRAHSHEWYAHGWPNKHRELQFSGQLQNQSRCSPKSLVPSIHLLEVAVVFEIVEGEQVSWWFLVCAQETQLTDSRIAP
jgi:hypothetical protein